jgi:hypothetical protein
MDVHAVVQQEDDNIASFFNNGRASVTGRGQVRGSASIASIASVAGTPLVGARIHTPCEAQPTGIGGNLSELMQFMLMCVEAEDQAKQLCCQDREVLEDRPCRERERASQPGT